MTHDELRAWVKKSREAQGLPEFIQDPAAYEKVAEFLNAPSYLDSVMVEQTVSAHR